MRSEGILIVILILFKVFILSLKHANADIWGACNNSFTPQHVGNYSGYFPVYEGDKIEVSNPLFRCGDNNYPNYVTLY